MQTVDMNYPLWCGRLSGFIRIIPQLYTIPDEVKEQFKEIIEEYDKALLESEPPKAIS